MKLKELHNRLQYEIDVINLNIITRKILQDKLIILSKNIIDLVEQVGKINNQIGELNESINYNKSN